MCGQSIEGGGGKAKDMYAGEQSHLKVKSPSKTILYGHKSIDNTNSGEAHREWH